MKQHDTYQGHLLVAGVAAIVASAVVAIAGLTLAQEGTTTTVGDASTSTAVSTTPTTGDAATTTAVQPVTGTAWQGDQSYGTVQQDPCSQAHSYQGDRCTKEQMLMKYGCVPDISPECKGGNAGNQPWGQQYPSQEQQGPTPEQISQALRQNGRGVCFFGSRWEGGGSPDGCAQQGGQWHGSYTQPSGQYHGGPDMSQWDTNMRQGQQPGRGPGMSGPKMGPGFPGMPGGMGGPMGPGMGGSMMGPGGPGRGGPMSCDMFNDVIEEMKGRLTEMDEETKDRWSDMEENIREKAAGQIERLQDKIDATDDQKKIAKYQKQITKIEGKIEKQITKTKARFEKQTAKMKTRMEKEIAKLEDKAAECEDNKDEGGDDFGGGGGFDGGGFEGNFGPNFGPGGPGGFGPGGPGGGFGF